MEDFKLEVYHRYIIQSIKDPVAVGEISVLEITETCYKVFQVNFQKPALYLKGHFHKMYTILEDLGVTDPKEGDIFLSK